MAGRFEAWQRLVAMAAAERWGMRDPCPADVLRDVLGERWLEENPGLASLVTSYAIGAED